MHTMHPTLEYHNTYLQGFLAQLFSTTSHIEGKNIIKVYAYYSRLEYAYHYCSSTFLMHT